MAEQLPTLSNIENNLDKFNTNIEGINKTLGDINSNIQSMGMATSLHDINFQISFGFDKLFEMLDPIGETIQKSFQLSQTQEQEKQIALQRAKSEKTEIKIVNAENLRKVDDSDKVNKKASKGFLSSFFGGLTGAGFLKAGLGAGAVAVGLGVFAGGAKALLKQMEEMNAKKIKDNVLTLLSIGDEFKRGNLDVFLKGGPLILTLTGLGMALATFSAGTAISAAVDKFAGNSNFAENIKDKLKSLLEIADFVKNDMSSKMIALPVTMALLGAGLAIFSAGGAISAGIDLFTGGGDWAESVKEKVKTLLSIANFVKNDMATKMIALPTTLGLLGAGLAVFSTGGAISAGVDLFSGKSNWAENIKEKVKTLMSIPDALGGAGSLIGKSATFLLSMSGIAAGLAVFGVGSGIAGVFQGLSDGLAFFTGEKDSASLIKSRVKTLFSIADDAASFIGKSALFLTGMTGIAAGLAVFGIGTAATGLLQGFSDGLAWFSGEKDSASLIKSRVKTLFSIVDDAAPFIGKTALFLTGMTGLAAGLAVFGVGNAANTVLSGGLGTSLTDLASGFGAIGEIDGLNLISVAAGIAAIGPAMGIFFGAKGLGEFVKGGVEKVTGFFSSFFSKGDEVKKGNMFTQMVDTLKPLQEIDGSKFKGFIEVTAFVEKFSLSLERLSNINTDNVKNNIKTISDNLSKLHIPEELESKINATANFEKLKQNLDTSQNKNDNLNQGEKSVSTDNSQNVGNINNMQKSIQVIYGPSKNDALSPHHTSHYSVD